jgi:hypothetical protein
MGLMEPTAGLEPATYGLRKRCFSAPEAAAQHLDVPGLARTVPSLRVVDAPIVPESAGELPAVTADLFVQAAAIAAQQWPEHGALLLQRGLAQARALNPIA